MKTAKAKGERRANRGDMRVFMALAETYDACLQNATDLLDEAQLLLDHARHARAFALAYTGWEEVGKAQIVADFAYEMTSQAEFEAGFKDHHLKAAYNWRQFVLDTENVDDSTIEYDRGRAAPFFAKRQAAFYVSKTESYAPIAPSDSVSREEADAVIRALRKELDDIRHMDFLTERMGSKSFLK